MLSLRKSILVSALFHVGIFVLFFFLSIAGGSRIIYTPQYQVRLVSAADVPSLRQGPSSPAPTTEAAMPVEKISKKEVVLPDKEPKKPAPKNETEAKSKGEAKEKALDDVLARLGKKAKTGQEAGGPPAPVGRPGTGLEDAQTDLQYSEYYDQVEQRVRENWIPPQNLDLAAKGVVAVVSITLLPDGRVLKSYIEESSGDPIFDQSVMRAIMKSTPLPPPPIEMEQSSFDLGLRFHSSANGR